MHRHLLALSLAIALLVPEAAAAYSFISNQGCAPGRGAAWPERLLPSPWHLHDEGYSLIPQDTLQPVLRESIEVWSEPCCTSFRSEYAGLSTVSPTSRLPVNVVAFEELAWPRYLGSRNNVIAVTLVLVTQRCEILGSDMLFNGDGFRFVLGEPAGRRQVDLQSIATHEFGHWLGLDHSITRDSTMFPTYQGGTKGRFVFDDDRQGVCALYPWPCDACYTDSTCPMGHRCRDGDCEAITCLSLDDCPAGTVCNEGRCQPGCRHHLDCPEGTRCDEGICVERFEGCRICDQCHSHEECGPVEKGYFCGVMEGRPACTKSCTTDADCPGGTVCTAVHEEASLCLPPNDPDCRFASRCEATPLCPGRWEGCDEGAMGCGGASDACVAWEGASRCTCTCRTDEDCGGNAFCELDVESGTRVCWPNELREPCGKRYCRFGEVCREGSCLDACGEMKCDIGETCVLGTCQPVCGKCAEDEFCDLTTQKCSKKDPCAEMSCQGGRSCRMGVCVDLCESVRCGADEVCLEGACIALPSSPPPPKKKKGGGCEAAGGEWAGGIAALWLALAAGRRSVRKGG